MRRDFENTVICVSQNKSNLDRGESEREARTYRRDAQCEETTLSHSTKSLGEKEREKADRAKSDKRGEPG